MLIYKILRPEEWQMLRELGETQGAPIDITDGYIHFSTSETVVETAEKHFAGAGDLWILALDPETFDDPVKWEVSRGDQLFPHLYGPLKLKDVVWSEELPEQDGNHVFPRGVGQEL